MPYGVYKNIICDKGSHPPFTPQEHQSEVLDYFINKSKYKGLCLYHRLGSGKSCSSIMISDEMLKLAKKVRKKAKKAGKIVEEDEEVEDKGVKIKKIFVMTPGSLRQNFIEEYCDRCGYEPEFLKKYYTFITTNYAVGERLPNLNNSLVIIDEVHNLINGVKNKSKHATLIYKSLMKANCRILVLTGTPVFNYIWEWPLLGNLLKPNTFINILKGGELDQIQFERKFEIDEEGNIEAKNARMFSAQLNGIISYFPGKSGDGYYPEVIHEKPITIQMTIPQNESYWKIALWENDVRMRGPPLKSLLRTNPKEYSKKMEEFIMASKYIMSRFTSNFYYPDDIRSTSKQSTKDELHRIGKITMYKYKPTGDIKSTRKEFVDEFYNNNLQKYKLEMAETNKELTGDKWEFVCKEIKRKVEAEVKKNIVKDDVLSNIGWVKKELFSNHQLSDMYSRKITAFLTNLVIHWKSKHVLFTFYKTKSGVNIIHALLEMCGIKSEIYSGDISDSKRKMILKNFNAENNRYGDKIKVLLVTEAGAEGINILEAQHMHILESSTREMKIQQAIGRVVRYKSHAVEGRKPMPKNEQVVHVWRYWSTSDSEPYVLKSSDGKKDKIITNKTCVDEILYKKGIYNVNTIESFLNLIKQASVTPYDKNSDSSGKLKDWGILPVTDKLNNAYKLSDERYLNNKIPDDNSSIDDVVNDIMGDDVFDEDKDSKQKNKHEGSRDSYSDIDEIQKKLPKPVLDILYDYLDFDKKEHKKMYVEVMKYYTVKDTQNNPYKIFVFGDNTKEKGMGGQAIIRGQENAYGIVTKKSPNNKSSSYFTDEKFEQNIVLIEDDIEKIKLDGRKIIVFPQDGLGTGLSQLNVKAPDTYEYLKIRLLEEFGFDNDTGKIIVD